MNRSITLEVASDSRSQALQRVPPRARQTALAIGAGALTAVVIAVASSIVGHWG